MPQDNDVHVFPMMTKTPTNSLTAMVDEVARFASECFNTTHSLAPMFICDNSKGERLCIVPPIGNHAERELLAATLRMMFKDQGVVRYVFMCEAWTLRPGAIKDVRDLKGWIADRPDRVEAVAISGEDDEGNTIMVLFDIKRDKEHPYLDNKQVVAGSNNTAGGRFGKLLETKQQTKQ